MRFGLLSIPLALGLSLFASTADAQHEHKHDPAAAATSEDMPPLLCAFCPESRESMNGTSWQPDATPSHAHGRSVGDWWLTTHLDVAVVGTDEDGPRGDDKFFSTNHVMVSGRRRLGSGVFGVQTMWSLEPAMGKRGYPLLLQTGETADGVTPLVDRQHPHDFPMELAVTYSRPFGTDRGIYVYAAAVGAPAIGPPAFMHRRSASGLPTSPITHHWFDSSHVTFGVVTFGAVVSPKVKVETSAFRGREPDQHRWGFEQPKLDSFSFRLSINPSENLAVQVSAGHLEDAEQLHPGANLSRITASAMYSRQWGTRAIDALAAWGRNKRSPSSFPVPGGIYFMPGAVAQGSLLEATVHVASRHSLVARFEHADKDELFGLSDPRHITLFGVTRATTGYVFDVLQTSDFIVGLGAAVSFNRVEPAIRDAYGNSPRGVLGFARLTTH